LIQAKVRIYLLPLSCTKWAVAVILVRSHQMGQTQILPWQQICAYRPTTALFYLLLAPLEIRAESLQLSEVISNGAGTKTPLKTLK